MTPTFTETCLDPQIFGQAFSGSSFAVFRAVGNVILGQPVVPESERAAVLACLGGRSVPAAAPREVWSFKGRRAGGTLLASALLVYLAAFRNFAASLGPGERGILMNLAVERRQARQTLRYCEGLLTGSPLLASLVESVTAEAIHLTNRLSVETHVSSFRSVRGYSIVAAVCDELCFWRDDDSSNPAEEVLAALRPALATVPGSLLICSTSVYARRGVAWSTYHKHFGHDSDVLVLEIPTRTMNPTVPQSVIDAAIADDEPRARAEYLCQWRTDVESFVSADVVDSVIVPGRGELPPMQSASYRAFTDPSGGSADSFTLAITHVGTDGCAVLDAVRERKPPFSPERVVEEFAGFLNSYRVSTVTGDAYAGEWPREQFRKHGISYQKAEHPKSGIYGAFLAMVNSRRCELLDVPRLRAQLLGLERRTGRGGKDSIDHAPGQHDDVINAAAGALTLAGASASAGSGMFDCFTGAPIDADDARWDLFQ
jgi:hypothetical protein